MGPNPAARWLLCTGILLISLRSPATCEGLASEAQPPPNYQLANQCCNDPNILERPCRAGSIFNCTHGSYLLDPFQDPLDAFTIGGDGSLSLNSETLPYPKGEYCLSVSESPLHNESHYVARVCFWEAENVRYAQTMFTLKGTLALISVVFLGLTVYVYNVIVMRDTQDRVTRIAIICLLAFFLCIGATQLFSEVLLVTHTCSVMVFCVHFSILAYFSWINTVMANVWKSVVVPRWSIEEHRWYRWNHIYAWSIPTAVEVVMIFGHFSKNKAIDPRIGITGCWFGSDNLSMKYVYIPITAMLILNVVLFVWTCFVLHRYGGDFNPEKRNQLKYRVTMYLKFFLLVGLTWIFEVISFLAGDHVVWILFDIVNALHGLLLFLVLVVFRARIKRELAGKKLCCCLHAPEHWRNKVDIEHQRLNENDEEASDYTTADLMIKG